MEKINNQEKIQRLSKLPLFNGVYGNPLSSVTHGNGSPDPLPLEYFDSTKSSILLSKKLLTSISSKTTSYVQKFILSKM